MKSKLILISICLLFFTNAFSQENYYYIDGQKHYLKNISTKRILLEFEDDLNINDKNNVIKNANKIVNSLSDKGNILSELDFDKEQSSNDKYILNLSETSEEEDVISLINTLRSFDNVKYANFYYYFDKDGNEMHTFYDKVLVQLKTSTTEQDLKKLSEEYDFVIDGKRPYTKDQYVLKVTKYTNRNACELAGVLWETGLFINAQPAIRSIVKHNSKSELNNTKYSVNDPMFNQQWGLKSGFMDVQGAWDITKGSSNIKIAVLDVGVDLDHPDLTGNLLKDQFNDVIGYDCFNQANIPVGSYDYYNNIDEHGTQCAGCFGAKGDNHKGIAGVAYNCKIIPVRIARGISPHTNELDIDWSLAADALRWAAFDWQTKADVVSISIGMNGYWDYDFKIACDEVNALGRYYNNEPRGLPIVVASGNSDGVVHHIDFPADLTTTIAVGASNQDNERASFSDYGIFLDLIAPGTNIVTTNINGGYTNSSPIDGTSFSAPYVAGIFALMYSKKPQLYYNQAKTYLFNNCEKPDGYSYSGKPYGLWNEQVGYGIPDAKNILTEIQNSTGELDITITPSKDHFGPGENVYFTASCNNCTGDARFIWSINTVEGELGGPCSYTSTGCYQAEENPSSQISFPDIGSYYVYVWAQDMEDYRQGSTYRIMTVDDHLDPCIELGFNEYYSGSECISTYEVNIGEYFLKEDIALLCWGNDPNHDYDAIKAYQWLLDGEQIYYQNFNYKPQNNETQYFGHGCFNFTIDDVGEHTITLKAWAAYEDEYNNSHLEFVDQENAYSAISKKIKVVNANSTREIDRDLWEGRYRNMPYIKYGTILFNPDPFNLRTINIRSTFVPRDIVAYNKIVISKETTIKATSNSIHIGIIDKPPYCPCDFWDKGEDHIGIQNHRIKADNSSDNSENNESTVFVINKPENRINSNTEVYEEKLFDFEVIPNPFDNSFELLFSDHLNAKKIEITDISGLIVYSETLNRENKKRVNGTNFSKGVYFIRVYSDTGIVSKKIVKQ